MAVDPFERAERLLEPLVKAAKSTPGCKEARVLVTIGARLVHRVLPVVFDNPDLDHDWEEVGPFVLDVVKYAKQWVAGEAGAVEALKTLAGDPLEVFRRVCQAMSEFELDAGGMVEAVLYGTLALDPSWPIGEETVELSREVAIDQLAEVASGVAAGVLVEVDNSASEDEYQRRFNKIIRQLSR